MGIRADIYYSLTRARLQMHNFESGLLLNEQLFVSLGNIVECDNLDLGSALICIDLGGRDREIAQILFWGNQALPGRDHSQDWAVTGRSAGCAAR